jgi:hypothetical protein
MLISTVSILKNLILEKCFSFVEADSKYTSHDQETITRSSIFTESADLNLTYNKLKGDCPFVLPFLTSLFSASGV